MKSLRTNLKRFALPAFLTVSLVACDDDTTGVTIDDLQGVWNATQAELLTSTGQSIDLLALEATITLVIQDVERYTLSIAIPNEVPQVLTGSIVVVDDNTLTIVNDQTGNSYTATYMLDGDALDMTVPDIELADPPTGIPDQATFDGSFSRSGSE